MKFLKDYRKQLLQKEWPYAKYLEDENISIAFVPLYRLLKFCAWSHGTELITLGRKLHSGTSKTKELVPVQTDFPLFWKSHMRPRIINSLPCDRIVESAH